MCNSGRITPPHVWNAQYCIVAKGFASELWHFSTLIVILSVTSQVNIYLYYISMLTTWVATTHGNKNTVKIALSLIQKLFRNYFKYKHSNFIMKLEHFQESWKSTGTFLIRLKQDISTLACLYIKRFANLFQYARDNYKNRTSQNRGPNFSPE